MGPDPNDPDLTDFKDLLLLTEIGGADRVDPPTGPSQRQLDDDDHAPKRRKGKRPEVSPDWSGLDPDPKSNSDMLSAEQEDPDEGIAWDDDHAQDEQKEDR